MGWWAILSVVLAAPTLLLALAGWALRSAFRQVCAAVLPRPIESEWDAVPPRVFCPAQRANRLASKPVFAADKAARCSLN